MAKKKKLFRVFVYGSLRRGNHNNHWLKGAELIATTQTVGAGFTMLDIGMFPGVIYGGKTVIIGEVYAVDAATLEELDRHEGCPRHYRREVIKTADCGECFTYIYQMPTHARSYPRHIVHSGDWVEYKGYTGETQEEPACVRKRGTLFAGAD